MAYYAKAEQDGRIESHETVLLYPHGGNLAGFILARGSAAQIAALRVEDEFDRITTRPRVVQTSVSLTRHSTTAYRPRSASIKQL